MKIKDDSFSFNFTTQNTHNYKSKLKESKSNEELLKHIDILYEENLQLKEALTDLEKDLKDKDQSIEESQKIITKLKEEYTKVVKELQQMEKSYNQLLDDINKKSIEINNSRKNQSILNDLKKKNESLSTEKNNLHKENIIMRKKILSCGNISYRNERNIKNKDIIIDDLQKKEKNYIRIIKERDNLIDEKNNKIKQLSGIINNKNGELKIMMNISKEINKENKINVKELTKQAVKTIRTFKNNIYSKEKRNYSTDSPRIKFINSEINFEDFEFIFKNHKASFLLEDAISKMMFIPDNLDYITKEFLVNMYLKTELIKNELFSGLIRESQFINFLKLIFDRMHLNESNDTLNIFYEILEFKNKYLNIVKENYKIKKINKILFKINHKYYNDLKLLKENINNNNEIIRNKWTILIKSLNENNINKDEKIKEIEKLKNEIKRLFKIIRSNTENKSTIKSYQHLSSNFAKSSKNRVKIFGKLDIPKIWNTLPSGEVTGISDTNFDKKNITEIQRGNNNLKINKIKKAVFKINNNKKMLYKKIDNEISLYDNSLTANNHNTTENSISQRKTYSSYNINSSYNALRKKSNYKNDIFNLQKEFNNILMKSETKDTFNLKKTKIFTPRCIQPLKKINSSVFSQNNFSRAIFTERIPYKNKDILESKEDNHNSMIIQGNKRINNYKKFSIIDNNIITTKNNNNIFGYNFFINLFFNINDNIFDLSELNKYRQIYNFSDIENIYSYFKETCNILKSRIDETNLKIEKSHYLSNVNFSENINFKSNFFEGSFKLFNEKIISLKKFEFEFINMNEFIKNYLVSQEITIQIMFDKGQKQLKFEPIESLFNLVEDGLNYRIDEMDENIIFNRKLMIKMLKNQINCLFLCFENNIN